MFSKLKACFAVIGLAALISSTSAQAGTDWLRGDMSDVWAAPEGLYIKLHTGVPSKCYGLNAYSWMLIPEENKTILSFAMAKWFSTSKSMDVYVKVVGSVCTVTSIDSN
jgi:hypothetical protein